MERERRKEEEVEEEKNTKTKFVTKEKSLKKNTNSIQQSFLFLREKCSLCPLPAHAVACSDGGRTSTVGVACCTHMCHYSLT